MIDRSVDKWIEDYTEAIRDKFELIRDNTEDLFGFTTDTEEYKTALRDIHRISINEYDRDNTDFNSRLIIEKMELHYGIDAETTNRVLHAVADELIRSIEL